MDINLFEINAALRKTLLLTSSNHFTMSRASNKGRTTRVANLVPQGQPRVLLVVPVLVASFLDFFHGLGFESFCAPRCERVRFERLLRRQKLGGFVCSFAVAPRCSFTFPSSSSSCSAAAAAPPEGVVGRPASALFGQRHAAVDGHEMTGFNC